MHCLIVKVLRSPHAHAWIEKIDTKRAKSVPGIECVLTYQDVPSNRFTNAGQTYPEPSPYDRLILEQRVRYVGDEVAIVAGKDEACVNKALQMIKVKYKVLEPVIDFREALDNKVIIHPEEDWKALCPVGADNRRNLCAQDKFEIGNVDDEFSKCDVVISETYHTKANNQGMMEPFVTFTEMDPYGRIVVTSSTQIPFHVRRIVATALDIPKSKVRVVKPRIGGGFGAKQTVVSELFPAIVTLKTGKAAKMIYTRREVMIASTSRHEMEIAVRLGADKDGIFKAVEICVLSNTGAHGEHGPTTVGLAGHKSMSLYETPKAYRFDSKVVYSNTMPSGAYRGYGATQGTFALESAVNQLAAKLEMDPVVLREKNLVHEGHVMKSYYNEELHACALDRCLSRASEMIGWKEKYPFKDMGNGKVRSVGVAMAMQGSGITCVDQAAVEIRLSDEGFYNMMIGAADMGTGCDTILAQMAAECLDCSVDQMVVYGVDTDISPYDTGSYASSTTYVTGMAVIKTCNELKEKMMNLAAKTLGCREDNLEFDGEKFYSLADEKEISLSDLATKSHAGVNEAMSASQSHCSPVSPPPFMVGMIEMEVDLATGQAEPVDYVAVVDCGTPINVNLAKVQTEGGIVQGIGMALYEEIAYNHRGAMVNNSFMQYKVPTRMDMGQIRVDFESSYEPTGPFGAKSIGEIVINTPSPAIAHAIYNATGAWHRTLPITSEKILMGMLNKDAKQSS